MSNSFELLEKVGEKLVGWVRINKVDQIFNLHNIIIGVCAGLKAELPDLGLDAGHENLSIQKDDPGEAEPEGCTIAIKG